MQKGHLLEFSCSSCESPVTFSIFNIKKSKSEPIQCPECAMKYDFSDSTLQRQLEKFENLCKQIQQSEEILSQTSIGVHIGDKEVKIPFKLLLTRLNSTLDLMMDGKPFTIRFRVEPAKDMPAQNLVKGDFAI